jgi:voltage-dependent potassium channel beta subunit
MEYKNLGRSGLKVSRLSLGSWVTFGNQISDDVAEALMVKAYDAGVNFFDNAEVYANGKSEIVMGNILKKMGWGRDTYVVSSKVFWGGKLPNQWGLSRKHITEACNAALKRLQVDYLDLFFCHRADIETPLEETVFAMNDLIRQGKILYWGTSEWDAQRITEAIGIAKENHLIPPVMEQPQYNMFHRDRFELEYRNLYRNFGYGTTIWSPLASGMLTGKYNNGMPADTRAHLPELSWLKEKFEGPEGDNMVKKVQQLQKVADEIGTSLPKLAIAWCLKNPNVSTVILGASKVSQLEENLAALEVTEKLTEDVMTRIEGLLNNKPKFPVYG